MARCKDVAELVKVLCREVEDRGAGFRIYRGPGLNHDHWKTVLCVEDILPEGFETVGQWSNGFRTVWKSDKERATVTVCEGDVSVASHEREASYRCDLAVALEFYKTH